MQTFELLDRFELLYPTNSKLADLRRAYIDKDLSSIFRLLNADEELRKAIMEKNLHSIFRIVDTFDTEELRKAVIEDNLHSIFRLVEDEDLRKLIMEDNTWKLWPVLHNYTDTQFVEAFKNFFVNETEIWDDCFSRGQIESKLWLIKELKQCNIDLGTVFLCGGWYATLATMLFESTINVDKIRSFDIDPSCRSIAETFNKPWVKDNWQFKSSTKDIMDINYEFESYEVIRADGTACPLDDTPDTIINTSCEHMDTNWFDTAGSEQLIVMQTNNKEEFDGHINVCYTIEEMQEKYPLSKILYTGSLETPAYTRFMQIGYK